MYVAENARLVEKTRERSLTDELIGLGNRRHFYERLEAEISHTRYQGMFYEMGMDYWLSRPQNFLERLQG